MHFIQLMSYSSTKLTNAKLFFIHSNHNTGLFHETHLRALGAIFQDKDHLGAVSGFPGV